jgi:hypothetical protein
MAPLFMKGPRGKAFVKVPDMFHCSDHDQLARGRKRVQFL